MNYALSLGAGINSTSLLLLIHKRNLPLNQVMFADTGGEHPETYEYIEKFIKPFCEEKGLPFIEVKSQLPTLEQYALSKNKTPSRLHRWCTREFKILPLIKNVPEPCTFYMGICYDEIHRMHEPRERGYGRVFFNKYPLVDWKMTRNDCATTIKEHGWPIPIKSGCFYCPFSSLSGWENLWRKHPDLYDRAIKVEQSDKQYPKFTLTGNGKPLIELRNRWGYGDFKLDQFIEDDPCDSGFCMT